jgi:hypothetical protein
LAVALRAGPVGLETAKLPFKGALPYRSGRLFSRVVFFPQGSRHEVVMVIALVGLALAMVAAGAWAIVEGYGIIVLERGWALVIAGSTAASLGLVLLGIAAAVARLGAIRGELVRLRERLARPEPDYPEPPGRVDPVLAVSSGLLAGGATDPAPAPVAPVLPVLPASPVPPVPAPEPDPRSDAARLARREEAAQRRANRTERPADPAPVSAGAIAAGAAAAVAAGAAVSAGLAVMRGRSEASDDLQASGTGVGTGAGTPIPPVSTGDELLPDRGLGPAGGPAPAAADVNWPVVPPAAAGDEAPAFPSGPLPGAGPAAGASAPAFPPSPLAAAEENAPFATHDPVVPDVTGGGQPAAEGDQAVLGTYNSGGSRYVMFADGSIEAETPDGTFRFGSLDELKAFMAAGGERPREG